MANPWDNDPIVASGPAPLVTKHSNPYEQRTIQAKTTSAEGEAAQTPDQIAITHQKRISDTRDNMTSVGDQTKHGQAYLDSIPPNTVDRNIVKMLASNQVQVGNIARSNAEAKLLVGAAKQYNPSYDPSMAPVRQQALFAYTGNGEASQRIQALDRAAASLKLLKGYSDQMDGPNTGYSPLNSFVARHQQDAGQQRLLAAKGYDTILPEAMGQLDNVLAGSKTVSGSAEIKAGLDPHASKAEREVAFTAMARAIVNAGTNLKAGWNSAYGGTAAPPVWMSPDNASFIENLTGAKKGSLGADEWHALPGVDGGPNHLAVGGPGDSGGGNGGGGSPLKPTDGNPDSPYSAETTKGLASILRGGGTVDDANHYLAATADGKGHQVTPANWATEQKFLADYRARTGTDYTGPIGAVKSDKPTPAQDAVSAFGLNGSPSGTFLANYANAAGAGIPGLLAGQGAQANLDQASSDNPKSALTGNALGGLTAMYGGGEGLKALGLLKDASPLGEWAAANPIKSSIAGNAAYGGVYGAASDPNAPVTGAAAGMFAGGAGAGIGSGIANVGGKLLKGVTNPAADYLRSQGVPLTAGEVLGGGWKKAQDASTSIPLVGDLMGARYGEGRAALNKAAFNIAAQPVDQQINATGSDGLKALQGVKNNAYTNALGQVNLNLDTPNFIQGVGQTLGAAKALPEVGDTQAHALASLKTNIGDMAPDGTMNGPQFQNAYRGLSTDANTRPSTAPFNYQFGQVLGQGKQNLVDALNEQNPGAFGDFLNANKVNRNLSVLTDATGAAKNQFGEDGSQHFTPAQLNTAWTNNGTKYDGKLAALTSDDPMGQLAQSGQQVMSSRVGDSGTTSRGLVALGAMGLVGGGIGGEEGGKEGIAPGAALPLGLLAAANSKIGQQILTAALLKRSAGMGMFGNQMIKASPYAGTALAGVAAGSVPSYLSGF